MVELKNNTLQFSFPEVHPNARLTIEFQRTLRIPDDNKQHHLPPGFGRFPIEHVDDHAKRLPEKWVEHGGVLLPMYQAEALWINFEAYDGGSGVDYPFAVKIFAGKVNVANGEVGDRGLRQLHQSPQNYVVVPEQPWLDGFCVGNGLVRQFVAAPLGQGYTAEEQLSGKAEFGGLQIFVYPMRRKCYEKKLRNYGHVTLYSHRCYLSCDFDDDIGLAPGGLMEQEVYQDEHSVTEWDVDAGSRCFVHLLNSERWQQCTGKPMPTKPVMAADYNAAGLPWFDYYNAELQTIFGSEKLAGMQSLAAKAAVKGGAAGEGKSAICDWDDCFPTLFDEMPGLLANEPDPGKPKKVIDLAGGSYVGLDLASPGMPKNGRGPSDGWYRHKDNTSAYGFWFCLIVLGLMVMSSIK